MPKINASSVAEHRKMRHSQVLHSAVDLLTNNGPSAVTPAAVAKRCGIARSSVYQYFPSSGALIAGAIENLFVDANERIATAVAAAGDNPAAQLRAYVYAALVSAEEGHSPATMMHLSDLPPDCRRRIGDLHREMGTPLRGIVRIARPELSESDVTCLATLGLGSLLSASALLQQGERVTTLAETTTSFMSAALGVNQEH